MSNKDNPTVRSSLPTILPMPGLPTQPKVIDIPRPKRTRAKRSCDLCRKKRTRCNANVSQPCATCKNAGVPCQFLDDQKKRGPSSSTRKPSGQELEHRVKRMEEFIANLASNQQASGLPAGSLPTTSSLSSQLTYDNNDSQRPMTGQREESPSELSQQMRALTLTDYEKTVYFGQSSGVHLIDKDLFPDNEEEKQPSQEKWIVHKLNEDEDEQVIIKSEERRQSQSESRRFARFDEIPNMTQELADCMIHIFFKHVHPFIPIINKIAFLEQYYFHNPCPPDEYLLYAVLAVATRFMLCRSSQHRPWDRDVILSLRQPLWDEAEKVLINVHKRSKISTVQTLLLLSMFFDMTENVEEDTFHWFTTGMAIRMAQDLGLHRRATRWHIPEDEVELRRRIWFAAYMMDKWVAADLGRPAIIMDVDFDVECPSPYEIDSCHRSSTRDPNFRHFTPGLMLEAETDIREKRPVYNCFVNMVNLSQILGHVLIGFHSPKTRNTGPRNFALVDDLDARLDQWKINLPQELQYDMASANVNMNMPFAAIVNICYSSVVLLLHRPFINHKKSENVHVALRSLSTCTAAANNIIDFVESMEYQGFMPLPWVFVAFATFQAAIIFLFNAKGDNPYTSRQGARNLMRCAQAYEREESVKTSRITKVLLSLADRFSVPVVPQTPQRLPTPPAYVDSQTSPSDTTFAAMSDQSSITTATTTTTSTTPLLPVSQQAPPPASTADSINYTNSMYIPYDPGNYNPVMVPGTNMMQGQQQQQQQQLAPAPQVSVSGEPMEFDLANLISEVPLWDIPSGVTWSEWDAFLQTDMNGTQ